MKNFLIFVLGIACLLLFYSVKIKTQKLEEQEAVVADLNKQLDAAKQAAPHVAPAAPPVAALQIQPIHPNQPAAPVVSQVTAAPASVSVTAAVPGQNMDKALGEFAAVMKADIATSPPPFVIFMDEAAAKRDAQTAEEQGLPQSDTVRRMGIDRYNGFMTHLFPGRPDLRTVAPAPGEPENASSSQVNVSPAKLLWVAVDDASPDAKYALRWMKVNSPQLTVTETAMQTLDQEIAGNVSADAKSAALARGLHDAQNALKRLLNGKPPVAEDQREVAFFLRTAGVSK